MSGAVFRGGWDVVRGRERLPAADQPGGRLGLPAGFLIGADGRVLAAEYGEQAYDQWPVEELLHLASSHRHAAGRPPER
ncbi:hypothetical protein [Streptomyces tibetensis]|uniref:hypothetical protein n=1 Tax=Streptomyces tibetensis TaxID=2382123 RepID=UPI0033DD010E